MMQLLSGLGAKVQSAEGIQLQINMLEEIKKIVRTQRDKNEAEHYSMWRNFVIDKAIDLGLLDEQKAQLYRQGIPKHS